MVGLREYQDAKADVIMKYNSDEARRLKNMGQLPDTVNVRIFFLKKIFYLGIFLKIFLDRIRSHRRQRYCFRK